MEIIHWNELFDQNLLFSCVLGDYMQNKIKTLKTCVFVDIRPIWSYKVVLMEITILVFQMLEPQIYHIFHRCVVIWIVLRAASSQPFCNTPSCMHSVSHCSSKALIPGLSDNNSSLRDCSPSIFHLNAGRMSGSASFHRWLVSLSPPLTRIRWQLTSRAEIFPVLHYFAWNTMFSYIWW